MPPGGRNPFTSDEEKLLVKFIATYNPTQKGRAGNALYRTLCADVDNKWKWSRSHTWQSWRDHYVKNRSWYDAQIRKYQRKHGILDAEPSHSSSTSKITCYVEPSSDDVLPGKRKWGMEEEGRVVKRTKGALGAKPGGNQRVDSRMSHRREEEESSKRSSSEESGTGPIGAEDYRGDMFNVSEEHHPPSDSDSEEEVGKELFDMAEEPASNINKQKLDGIVQLASPLYTSQPVASTSRVQLSPSHRVFSTEEYDDPERSRKLKLQQKRREEDERFFGSEPTTPAADIISIPQQHKKPPRIIEGPFGNAFAGARRQLADRLSETESEDEKPHEHPAWPPVGKRHASTIVDKDKHQQQGTEGKLSLATAVSNGELTTYPVSNNTAPNKADQLLGRPALPNVSRPSAVPSTTPVPIVSLKSSLLPPAVESGKEKVRAEAVYHRLREPERFSFHDTNAAPQASMTPEGGPSVLVPANVNGHRPELVPIPKPSGPLADFLRLSKPQPSEVVSEHKKDRVRAQEVTVRAKARHEEVQAPKNDLLYRQSSNRDLRPLTIADLQRKPIKRQPVPRESSTPGVETALATASASTSRHIDLRRNWRKQHQFGTPPSLRDDAFTKSSASTLNSAAASRDIIPADANVKPAANGALTSRMSLDKNTRTINEGYPRRSSLLPIPVAVEDRDKVEFLGMKAAIKLIAANFGFHEESVWRMWQLFQSIDMTEDFCRRCQRKMMKVEEDVLDEMGWNVDGPVAEKESEIDMGMELVDANGHRRRASIHEESRARKRASSPRSPAKEAQLRVQPLIEDDDAISDYVPPFSSRAGQFARLVSQGRKEEALAREERRGSRLFWSTGSGSGASVMGSSPTRQPKDGAPTPKPLLHRNGRYEGEPVTRKAAANVAISRRDGLEGAWDLSTALTPEIDDNPRTQSPRSHVDLLYEDLFTEKEEEILLSANRENAAALQEIVQKTDLNSMFRWTAVRLAMFRDDFQHRT